MKASRLVTPACSYLGGSLFPHHTASAKRSSAEIEEFARRALSHLARHRKDSDIASTDISVPHVYAPLVARLYDAATGVSAERLRALVTQSIQKGISVQTLTAQLLPAVACRLGEDWENDVVGFSKVTLGCARLQTAVRQLEGFDTQSSLSDRARRTNCLVLVPEGAQHTLGAVVLATQLRQAGSHVRLCLGASEAEMVRLASEEPFHMILISAALGQDVPALRALVKALRVASAASEIIIGGGILEEHADLARLTGADFVTNNWKEALLLSTQGVSPKEEGL